MRLTSYLNNWQNAYVGQTLFKTNAALNEWYVCFVRVVVLIAVSFILSWIQKNKILNRYYLLCNSKMFISSKNRLYCATTGNLVQTSIVIFSLYITPVILTNNYNKATWSSWLFKSPAPRLLVQQFAKASIKGHKSSVLLALVMGIHLSPVESHHKRPCSNAKNVSVSSRFYWNMIARHWEFTVTCTWSFYRNL